MSTFGPPPLPPGWTEHVGNVQCNSEQSALQAQIVFTLHRTGWAALLLSCCEPTVNLCSTPSCVSHHSPFYCSTVQEKERKTPRQEAGPGHRMAPGNDHRREHILHTQGEERKCLGSPGRDPGSPAGARARGGTRGGAGKTPAARERGSGDEDRTGEGGGSGQDQG